MSVRSDDLLGTSSPVSTKPGLTAMNKIPSFLYSALYLAMAILRADLVME